MAEATEAPGSLRRMRLFVPSAGSGAFRLGDIVTEPLLHIPEGVIERLPLYLNVLIQMRQDGQATASSARLGESTGVNPAQIRRDLTHFGSFGRRGVGYDVVTLIDRIQSILGSDQTHRLVLVGAGNLGSAIAAYDGLRKHGFVVSCVFDADPLKIGSRLGDIIVRDVAELERIVSDQAIRIGVIAVPPSAAQSVTDRLASAGIRVILNYTPVVVRVPVGVTLHNTDPVQELLHTLYYLSRRDVTTPAS
ncbi:MAG: redox-sensing transcriptional repressor Rex [Coriobacteriia bacterium]|nr:redox-sensing transcriptional repressor Rex [Coriobacteriia bacterium]